MNGFAREGWEFHTIVTVLRLSRRWVRPLAPVANHPSVAIEA